MTAFANLICVSETGSAAPMYLPGNENVFTSADELARQLRNEKIIEIKWTCGGIKRRAKFDYISSATLDLNADLLVVALHFSDKRYKRPANAVVINPDGTMNHILQPPEFVLLPDESSFTEKRPVEAISEVLSKNGRTLVGLNYSYEMIERRYYDPLHRRWLQRDQIYRR